MIRGNLLGSIKAIGRTNDLRLLAVPGHPLACQISRNFGGAAIVLIPSLQLSKIQQSISIRSATEKNADGQWAKLNWISNSSNLPVENLPRRPLPAGAEIQRRLSPRHRRCLAYQRPTKPMALKTTAAKHSTSHHPATHHAAAHHPSPHSPSHHSATPHHSAAHHAAHAAAQHRRIHLDRLNWYHEVRH